jgi:hypothetical protein
VSYAPSVRHEDGKWNVTITVPIWECSLRAIALMETECEDTAFEQSMGLLRAIISCAGAIPETPAFLETVFCSDGLCDLFCEWASAVEEIRKGMTEMEVLAHASTDRYGDHRLPSE